MKQEAREAIIACGDVAAPLLMKMFDDPLLSEHRGDVILLLREINCRDAAPRLVELLELHNKFWRSVPLIDGRWNHGETPEDQKTIEGVVARLVYVSLYKMHQIALHGYIRMGLTTLANILTRKAKPRMKLH